MDQAPGKQHALLFARTHSLAMLSSDRISSNRSCIRIGDDG
jgi:hypothetical protein